MRILFITVVFLTAYGLQGLLFKKRSLRNLEYSRAFDKLHLFAGSENQMVEVIENRKWLPIPWFQVESRMPSSFEFAGAAELAEHGNRYHKSIFFLAPWKRIERRHTLMCNSRGVFDISSCAISCGDLFGTASKITEVEKPLFVTVYPKLLSKDEIPVPASRWSGDVIVKRWIMPDPFLYAGIREYRPGDPMRDIHWKASARTGELQVMQREHTSSPRIMILLNIQLAEAQWGVLNDSEAQSIEKSISLCASIALNALDSGIEVGIASNCKVWQSDAPLEVHPLAGAAQKELILDALAHIVIERRVNFHTFIEGLAYFEDTDFLIVSHYSSELIEQNMSYLRKNGNTAELHLVGEGK